MKNHCCLGRLTWSARILLVALIAISAVLAQPHLACAARLAITGGTVFDSVSGTMRPSQAIIIDGETITAIGTPQNPIAIPSNAQLINAQGKFIIPGLIDAHVHISFLLDAAGVDGTAVLPLYLGTGVTSVRSIGDHIVPAKAVADYAAAHPESCPRIFLGSPLIDGQPPFHPTAGIALTDPNQVPPFVDEMVSNGVSTLKLYVGVNPSVFARVVQEGHLRGLNVAAHLGSVSTQQAIDYGIDTIEHIWGAPTDSATMANLVSHNVMLDPTLVVFRNMVYLCDLPEVWQNPDNFYVPSSVKAGWDSYRMGTGYSDREGRIATMEYYKALTGQLYNAGVTLLAGTDTAEPYCPPGFALHQELELLVESGLPPAAALQCATINNARALNQSANLGSIEVGKKADMVVLASNPLLSIRNTRSIDWVVHNGILVDTETLLQPPTVQSNLLANPGFEFGVPFSVFADVYSAGWTGNVENGSYFCAESFLSVLAAVGPHSGVEAAASALARSYPPGLAELHQEVAVSPNAVYSASAWVRAADYSGNSTGFGSNISDSAGLRILEMSAQGQVLSQHQSAITIATADFRRLAMQFRTASATRSLRFVLYSNVQADEYRTRVVFDDCVLEQVPLRTVGQSKKTTGVGVSIVRKPVTAAFSGYFYVEETDRSSGIKVIGWATPEAVIDAAGAVEVLNGEPTFVPSQIWTNAGPWLPDPLPLAMSIRAAFSGLPGGLLATICGQVNPPGGNPFWISDGSERSLKVYAPTAYSATYGTYVKITGALGSEVSEGETVPVLRAVSVETVE